MKSVICFDPGNHTGWCARNCVGEVYGGTIFNQDFAKDARAIEKLFDLFVPDTIVFETFHLYPGAAKHLAHNDFYTVQLIGVIKYIALIRNIETIEQAPSVKKYSGGLDERWKILRRDVAFTEHVKDAYLHLKYFERFNENK